MTIITDYFYILILDMDDNLIHKEDYGIMFPSSNTVEKVMQQVAAIRKEDPASYTGKVDKRIRIIEEPIPDNDADWKFAK